MVRSSRVGSIVLTTEVGPFCMSSLGVMSKIAIPDPGSSFGAYAPYQHITIGTGAACLAQFAVILLPSRIIDDIRRAQQMHLFTSLARTINLVGKPSTQVLDTQAILVTTATPKAATILCS
jgi:hypothetical protein